MHFTPSSLLLAAAASLPLLTAATPVPGELIQLTAVYENGTIADSLELPKLAARDGCNSGNIFNVNHAVSLANDLQNNSPDQMTEANHRSWHSWTWGEARICIYNNYVFENTHVKRWEVGWVTKYIYNQCCNPGGNQNCAGGDATCHGDSGLSVHAVLQNSAYGCNQL